MPTTQTIGTGAAFVTMGTSGMDKARQAGWYAACRYTRCRAVTACLVVGLVVWWVSSSPANDSRKSEACPIDASITSLPMRPLRPLWDMKQKQLNAFVLGGTGAVRAPRSGAALPRVHALVLSQVGKSLIRELLRSKLFKVRRSNDHSMYMLGS